MDMHVRDLKPGDHQTHPLWVERLLLGDTDALSHRHEMRVERGGEVQPVVGLLHGDHQGVAVGDGVDRQERHARVVPMDEMGGKFAGDDH